MAAALNVHGDVTDEAGAVHTAVSIVVRLNIATLRNRMGTLIAERVGVATVTNTSRETRTITFDDGSEWSVLRKRRPCNCG